MGLLPRRCSLVVVTPPLFNINLYGRVLSKERLNDLYILYQIRGICQTLLARSALPAG
jgi:hypothetical protein